MGYSCVIGIVLDLDFMAKFKENLGSILKHLGESNFRACSNVSTDLIRTSEFVGFPEGVLVGEIFESLFDNIQGVYRMFDVDEKEISDLKEEITTLIEFLIREFPFSSNEAKATFYEKIVGVRYKATQFQVKYFREERKRKKRTYLPEHIELAEE